MITLKRLWHILFDYRSFCWRTAHAVNLWGFWHPRIGFGFDFYADFIPGHVADLNDPHDVDWEAEIRIGGGLFWFDFSMTIPNDNHPDDDVSCITLGMDTELYYTRTHGDFIRQDIEPPAVSLRAV